MPLIAVRGPFFLRDEGKRQFQLPVATSAGLSLSPIRSARIYPNCEERLLRSSANYSSVDHARSGFAHANITAWNGKRCH